MSVFTISVFIEGEQIDSGLPVYECDVQHELNRLPCAQLSFMDGSSSQQNFLASNSGLFAPGKAIELKIRYEDKADQEVTLFKGLIVKHAVEADANSSSLQLELASPAFKMGQVRKNAVFRNLTDDKVIQRLLENNGVEYGTLAKAKAKHAELVQYYCTDWDFLIARAEANALWVNIEGGIVNLFQPSELNATIETATPGHQFRYGTDLIYNLHLEIDAGSQIGKTASVGWDPKKLEYTKEVSSNGAFQATAGDLDPSSLAGAMGSDRTTLQSGVPMLTEELQAWSDAQLQKSRLAMMRGSFTVPGQTNIKPLQIMEIGGISDHFNGNTVITAVRHRISTMGWFTDVQFGLSPDWFTEQFQIAARPAGGLLPSVHGLQLGKVANFENDPEQQFRVKVNIPAFSDEGESVFARLASPHAGSDRGQFFYPEVGDEVVVGFLNDDPRHAIIVGSLYSGASAPPVPASQVSAANPAKGIFTRSGLALSFDDQAQTVSVSTSDQQSIVMNQAEGSIKIMDVNGNTIEMSSSGVAIKSAKDLTLEAAANVKIKGVQVDVQ